LSGTKFSETRLHVIEFFSGKGLTLISGKRAVKGADKGVKANGGRSC
jgi:hypothetical protein